MKQIIKTFLIVLFLMTLLGCDKPKSNNIEMSSSTENKPIKMVYYQQNGKLTSNSSSDEITIVSTETNKESIETNIYLVAKTHDNQYVYDLGKAEHSVLHNGSLNVLDIDNDGIDEILLFMEITGNGDTLAQIFKIRGDSIEMICDFNEYELNICIHAKKDKIITIKNESIDFSCDIDISKEYDSSTFDIQGKVLVTPQIFTLPVDDLLVDTSGDSITIYCNYGIKITNYIGNLRVGFQNEKIVSMIFTGEQE